MNDFYSKKELIKLGFCFVGDDILISKKASIYHPETVILGNHVRIDDFCILSGKITIGDYVHISAYTCIFAGEAGVIIGSFSGLSSRCAIYAISDDYSGNFLSNAMCPNEYRNVESEKVIIGNHVIVGTGSTILPGVKIVDGVAIGCMSLVKSSITKDGIYCGIPIKRIKDRSDKYKLFEQKIKTKK